MTFQISLAGKTIEIRSLYEQVHSMCREYLVEPMQESADLIVTIRQEDILLEREKSNKEYGAHYYSDGYLETLAVYRKIAEAMLEYDSWLMHGAVLAIEEKAYMMTASSGTGKTTLIRMALRYFEDSYVVNGDKPLLQSEDGQIFACGTPWSGKERMNRNCCVPLKAIFILERGEVNQLEELSFGQAFPILLQQTYKPEKQENMHKTLGLLSQMNTAGVKFYRLSLKRYSKATELENDEVLSLLRTIQS